MYLKIGKKEISIMFIGSLIITLVIIGIIVVYGNSETPEIPEVSKIPEVSDVFEPSSELKEVIVPEAQSDAFRFVKSMGAGWNLGNALDSIDNQKRGISGGLPDNITANEYYETLWGNPVTTPEMIASIEQMGFGAVRVPVTYNDHLDENFKINAEWLERVEQVVNYVLDNDMYCIINMHHDTGYGTWPWLKVDADNIVQIEQNFATVWKQIAEYFKDYSDKLLFESFNEILDAQDNWFNASKAAYKTVNRLNQTFVDTVRGTGGDNAERYLIVKTYAGGTDKDIIDAFVIPDDTAKERLIAGVHYYGDLENRLMENTMKRLENAFINKGVPVIISEFGMRNKNNTAERVNYAVRYAETAKQYGIAYFWWDDGGKRENAKAVDRFTLFDRYKNEWFFPEIAEALINTAE